MWNFFVILPAGEMKGMCVFHMKGEDGIGCSDSCDLSSCSRVGGIRNEPRWLNSFDCSFLASDMYCACCDVHDESKCGSRWGSASC